MGKEFKVQPSKILHFLQKARRKQSSWMTTCLSSLRSITGSVRGNMACKLRLVQVQFNGETEPKVCVQLEEGGAVVDVTALDPSIPKDMRIFLEGGETAMTAASMFV